MSRHVKRPISDVSKDRTFFEFDIPGELYGRALVDKCVFPESAFIDVVACDNAGKGSDAMPLLKRVTLGPTDSMVPDMLLPGTLGSFLMYRPCSASM